MIKKRHIKGEKYITPTDFAEHLGKSDFSVNRKVYYDRFLRNGLHFMEGIVILLKADDIAISSSLLATVYWSRDEDRIG